MKLFDTHAHCDDLRIQNEFEGGTEGYIKHQIDNGIAHIVNIGTNLDNSRVSIELAKKIPEVYASCGIHPYDIRFYDDVDKTLNQLENLLMEEKVVALGETGLAETSVKASNGASSPSSATPQTVCPPSDRWRINTESSSSLNPR